MTDRLEPTRALALKVWWAFLWRAAVGTVACAFVLGGVMGAVGQLVGLAPQTTQDLAVLIGFGVGLAVSVEMMYRVLRKRFKDFEIVLLARSAP